MNITGELITYYKIQKEIQKEASEDISDCLARQKQKERRK